LYRGGVKLSEIVPARQEKKCGVGEADNSAGQGGVAVVALSFSSACAGLKASATQTVALTINDFKLPSQSKRGSGFLARFPNPSLAARAKMFPYWRRVVTPDGVLPRLANCASRTCFAARRTSAVLATPPPSSNLNCPTNRWSS